MSTWTDIEADAPELAATVRARFQAHGMGLLATLRRDGSPRISGIEPLFALGELWMGMMPGSRKAADVVRDPRFALHSATTDKDVTHGDAKVGGVLVEVHDDDEFARFVEAFAAANGYSGPPERFPLFKADVKEVSTVKPAGDHLDIESWREGRGLRKVERF